MSEQLSSVGDAEPDFRRSFFGFDPHEVRSHLTQLNDRLAGLQSPGGIDPTVVAGAIDREVATAIDATVSEIGQVLEAARVSARRIREQADLAVSDSGADAVREAMRIRDEAEADAYAVRKSAWETSTELLESAQAEGARMRAAVERDALDIIGEAERRAHRQLAAARRDSDNVMQRAAVESDRLLRSAQMEAKEIVRKAEEEAATTLDQFQSAGTVIEDLQTEVDVGKLDDIKLDDTKLPHGYDGGAAVMEPSAVRVVYPEQSKGKSSDPNVQQRPQRRKAKRSEPAPIRKAASPAWADGTRNMRLVAVAPGSGKVPEDNARKPKAAPGSENHVEVANRGRDQGVVKQDDNVDTSSLLFGVDAPESVNRSASTDSNGIGTVGESTVGIRHTKGASTVDDLAFLFEELRMRETTESATRSAGSAGLDSQLALQDLRLLPVINRAVRGVKRQLTDMQREQMGALEKDPEGWAPLRSDFGPYLVHTISVMEREASDCGFSTAEGFTGIQVSSPRREPSRGKSSRGENQSFIDDLFDGVVDAYRTSRERDSTGRNLSNDLSREYRRWRTDEVDRRLRFLAVRAYHRGLVEGLKKSGLDKLLVMVEDCCDSCARLDVGMLAPDDLPTLPIHEACRCTVVPSIAPLRS